MPIRMAGLPACVVCSVLMLLSAAEFLFASDKSPSQPLSPLYERFAPHDGQQPQTDEVPNFQKHVSPLLGRLGCNGRACHGSFQGQGGFRLSLFGYDFEADHVALLEDGAGRVDLQDKLESLILTKPVDADIHEGGKRFEPNGWEYWVLRRWIESEAPYRARELQKLERLEVTPAELSFAAPGETQQLKALAHWEDGTVEDVTCLCRFQSNDAAIADISPEGQVTCGEAGDTHVVVSYDNAVVPILAFRPLSDQTGSNYPQLALKTEIDRLVVQKLAKLGVVPSELCSDEEFLRRASLDVTGTLPTAQEVLDFKASPVADKRAAKIEELLSRPGYAAQWTTFLCDITGNNEDQLRNFLPQQIRPENQWYQWIYHRIRDNVPYDRIVEGIVTASSRLPDESYRDYCQAMTDICQDNTGEKFAQRPGLVHYWARNNFKTAEDRAIGFAYSFLGVRIQCAQCHKHPFDQWSKTDFDNFERLFGAVQANQNTLSPDAKKEYAKMVAELEVDSSLKGNLLRRELGGLLQKGKTIPFPELTVRAPARPANKKNAKSQPSVAKAKLLGGDWVAMDEADVRGKLMDWLRSPENPYFAKAIVNRVWAQYFGVGIVDPADDLNLANAPSNAPLLDYLANGFVDNGYDLKWLHRQIVGSDTYQRSWVTNETNATDKHNFSHSLLRRLPAEATYDAVRMALVNDTTFEKARELDAPRAITKPGASARNQGRDDLSYALSVFGRSVRESNCDCDRSAEPSLLQTVFLVNDSAVQDWLSDPKTSWVASVADKYGWSLSGKTVNNKERQAQLQRVLDSFQQRKERIENRIDEARKNDQAKLVASMQKQKQDLIRQIRAVAKRNGIEDEVRAWIDGRDVLSQAEGPAATESRMTNEQAMWVAENAYLRSLSRQPNAQELAASIDFLRSDENPVAAVEGLMWSLINTKEFILNH
jgi:hypothetical protein